MCFKELDYVFLVFVLNKVLVIYVMYVIRGVVIIFVLGFVCFCIGGGGIFAMIYKSDSLDFSGDRGMLVMYSGSKYKDMMKGLMVVDGGRLLKIVFRFGLGILEVCVKSRREDILSMVCEIYWGFLRYVYEF